MRVLITGVTGFVGSHLAGYCLSLGVEVWGTKRCRSPRENIEHIRGLHLAETDLLDAGSSEEYGLVDPAEIPIRETAPLCPLSAYGVSKVGQDLLGYQYHRSYGLLIVPTRAFNHGDPRRGEQFVPSVFAKQIAEIDEELREAVVEVGNVDTVRDFTDVRDIARAYWPALERGEPGEVYNIGSGNSPKIGSILNTLLELSDVPVTVRRATERMRPSDVPVLVSDSSKFRERTGWEPLIDLEQMLGDTLDYWRERVRKPLVHAGASLR